MQRFNYGLFFNFHKLEMTCNLWAFLRAECTAVQYLEIVYDFSVCTLHKVQHKSAFFLLRLPRDALYGIVLDVVSLRAHCEHEHRKSLPCFDFTFIIFHVIKTQFTSELHVCVYMWGLLNYPTFLEPGLHKQSQKTCSAFFWQDSYREIATALNV